MNTGKQIAQQGNKYLWVDRIPACEVIALTSGELVNIWEIDKQSPLWIGRKHVDVDAKYLILLPMKYFGGQVPKETSPTVEGSSCVKCL